MTALVDTHAFLWLVTDDPRLSAAARSFLKDGRNRLLLSVASGWEIAIKTSLGKLTLRISLDELFDSYLKRFNIDLLNISARHLVRLAQLPHHHRDPFDRLLVAQSIEDAMQLVSADAPLDAYGIQRIW